MASKLGESAGLTRVTLSARLAAASSPKDRLDDDKKADPSPAPSGGSGRRWTGSAVKCRFDRLEEKLGRRYFQYMFRHTWITKKLRSGVDSHIVAALAGHSDTKMLDKVYSHVAEDHEFMLEQAGK